MTTSSNTPVRFHLSLNVSNLDQAVPFFEKLLQTSVAKRRPDYAKFELQNPPVVLSLEPRSPSENGLLNHLGFRFEDADSLAAIHQQLEALGISTAREDNVECCYARQSKFWVRDGDQRLWEFYVLEGDIDHRGMGQDLTPLTAPQSVVAAEPQPVVWEHRMGSPFELPSEPCDEIRLRGTFNVPCTCEERAAMLRAAWNALKPGGRISLHVLTAEEPLEGDLTLPGPAAYVKQVPVRIDLMNALEFARFVDIQLTTFRSQACFEFQGHPLRETRIEARRPDVVGAEVCDIVFKGPFREIIDDEGRHWRRGELVTVPESEWQALRESSVGQMFVELPTAAVVGSCGTSSVSS